MTKVIMKWVLTLTFCRVGPVQVCQGNDIWYEARGLPRVDVA